jgi:hypothetical protein
MRRIFKEKPVKFIKLPDGDWVNLSLATRICIATEEDDIMVAVCWIATTNQTFFKGENAIALLKILEENSRRSSQTA